MKYRTFNTEKRTLGSILKNMKIALTSRIGAKDHQIKVMMFEVKPQVVERDWAVIVPI